MARLNTKSAAYQNKLKAYILDSIQNDSKTLKTEREKLEYFNECFKSEFCCPQNLKRYPNHQERVKEYLMGPPSCINIAFTNYNILEIAKELHGVDTLTEHEEDAILERYFSHMAFHIVKMLRGLEK